MKVSKRQWITTGTYLAAGALCAALVVNTLSVPVRGATEDYVVEFDDIDGLAVGNSVMISGVRVGRVDAVDIGDAQDGTAVARVGITVEREHPLPQDVTAGVRYGDMLGARFLELSNVDPEPADPLESGGVIPRDRTTGPVDLTALMNGFKPLFDALDPEQTNQLTRSFVDTFSGQGGSVATLVNNIGTVGGSLGEQQEVFSALVTNLTGLMESVDRRNPQLQELLTGVAALSSAVVGSNDDVVAVIDQGGDAVSTLAAAMAQSNGAFSRSVTDLRETSQTWNATTGEFELFLTDLSQFADTVNRMGSYGSFLSLYLCNFTLEAGDLEANIFGATHSQVCQS